MKKEKEKGKEEPKEKILIASPVRQTAAVLREFLQSLESLERTTVTTDYLFVDDNEEEAASNMLQEFVLRHEGNLLDANVDETDANQGKGIYNKDEGGHYWRDEQIWRVAGLKNRILAYARDQKYDAVFLIDSDLVLHPRTLEQLVSNRKEIISNIFWTRWQPGTREMPQVWLQDEYALFRKGGKRNTGEEAEDEGTQTDAFLRQLRTPGCYEVGGLGACTLIRRNVLESGVSYDQIPNVSFWGEDRHFCIRAQALGFRLYVDTHFPAYHIYRLSELPGVAAFNRRAIRGEESISISLCMIVKNEEASLARCLDSVNGIADEIVIVDTGSTDQTRQIAARYTERIIDFEWVDDFAAARNFAFEQATSEYILWLDADDVFEQDDRVKLIDLKRSLDPAVDSVTMDYHLSFTAEGKVAYSLRRNRLVRRDRNYRWIGAVHEYLEVAGHLLHSDVAVTHKKDKEYTDRNLKIYRKREQAGEAFSPRDLYYFGNELKDHGHLEDAVQYYGKFLDTGLGWVEDQIAACQKIADCEVSLERSEKEVSALLRSFAFDLPRAEICCRLGGYFADRADYRKALYWYEQATRAVRPTDPMVVMNEAAWTWMPHLQLCVCYDRMGNRAKAKEHNDIALMYHPTHPSMLYNDKYFKDLEKDNNVLENA
ncbi:Glycosyl transferase family 2 [Paenibacillus sp. RU5A]|nr:MULTISPECIES: glycosyltransferase [unclassified Paenibacillus]SLK18189.1 Glycosyl transferase family 2 [Paenibacillus sp. RU5A]SOC75087.1 Glycosyl transferase family 2 [Paenibacillus sp. RU26A]SOC77164.1 Glycosyl transferase family 2 [Paenibacillus sp. RU5M]